MAGIGRWGGSRQLTRNARASASLKQCTCSTRCYTKPLNGTSGSRQGAARSWFAQAVAVESDLSEIFDSSAF